jgi:hypothetical protein
MKSFGILIGVLIFLTACSVAQPTPSSEPQQGLVYVNSTDLLIAESYPVQVSLHIAGDLPTPCHELRLQVAAPDDLNRIFVSVWSESDPAAICVQMLEPFEVNLPIRMDGAAEGTYSVWLNGELVGEFNYPA